MGQAKFNFPAAIAIDKDDNLYIADTQNHVIRKITPEGTVTTVAGMHGRTGLRDGAAGSALFCEPSGIAVDGSGVIYVADTGNHLIRKIDGGTVTTAAGTFEAVPRGEDYRPGAYADGSALQARFNFPHGLFYAGGVLFIADTGNHAVRVLKDGFVCTLAGNGEAGDEDGAVSTAMMNKPTAVVYSNGVLYITDSLNNKVKAVSFQLN
jgi:DNA-binding beta-propeller fold protein YncE